MTFKNSPFYTIQRQLSTVIELKPREQTRDTARISINLDANLASMFQSDSSYRAMVFCAAESFDAAWKPVEIAFPSHAELRCNQEDVKANLRGLKNKPGSTRPADITPFLRKKTGYPNNLELIYALTTKVRATLPSNFLSFLCVRSYNNSLVLTGQNTEVFPSCQPCSEAKHRLASR